MSERASIQRLYDNIESALTEGNKSKVFTTIIASTPIWRERCNDIQSEPNVIDNMCLKIMPTCVNMIEWTYQEHGVRDLSVSSMRDA